MKAFADAVSGKGWDLDPYGVACRVDTGVDPDGRATWVEVRLEPLLFGQVFVAVYTCTAASDGGLDSVCTMAAEKVPVWPGGPGSERRG